MNEYNNNGLKEGYWEHYWSNGNLMYKGNYINNIRNGYCEIYEPNGKLSRKGYFVNNKLHGYWEEYNGELSDKEFYL